MNSIICNPNLPSQEYVSCMIDRSRDYAKNRGKYMLEYKPKNENWRTVSIAFLNKKDANEYFNINIAKDFKDVFKRPIPQHRVVPLDISKRKGSWDVAIRNIRGKLVW